MRIGIDVSQLAYEGGVSNYLTNLVLKLSRIDQDNEYVLFFSSMRRNLKSQISNLKVTTQNVKIKKYKLPQSLLVLLWNKLHVAPIEWFIGDVDVFVTSDWTEPPTKKAKKVSILYDLIIYKYPEETHNKFEFDPNAITIKPNIVASLKRKHTWMKKESDAILCISESTKKDAMEILGIDEERLHVIYPGLTL